MTVALSADLDLRRERALRPAEQRREHLAGRIIVVVDRLLAEDDQLRLLFAGDLGEDLGDAERLDLFVGLDEDRAVGAHRERGAQRLLRLGRADRHRDDLGRDALFLEPDRFLDRDLVERVHAHLDVGEIDARAVHLDPRLHVVIDDAFDRDEHFHSHLHRHSRESGNPLAQPCSEERDPRFREGDGNYAAPAPSLRRRSSSPRRRDRWRR